MYLFILFFSCFSTLYAEIPSSTLETFPPPQEIYHPVSTANAEAQKNFNKGLTYIYAFNHDLAYSYFEQAAKLDTQLAMAYWGMALAIGQNINMDVTAENEVKAYALIQKALQLAPQASLSEQHYIKALSERYTNNPEADFIPLRYRYRNAMKKVATTYPEDLDAVTLYAESILDLDPWKYWDTEGNARDGTWEAIDCLESVLRRNPEHLGANHYYIHILEGSRFPERALPSAQRLETLLPDAGHLLHMPCHIFLLLGDYRQAVATSKKAIKADREYIKEKGMEGSYPAHYLSHNYLVLIRAYMLLEDYLNALSTASQLQQFWLPHASSMLKSSHFAIAPLQVYLYFHKWREIIEYKTLGSTPAVQAFEHYSRATAFAHLNNLPLAHKEQASMREAVQKIEEEEISGNSAKKVLQLADILLEATLAKTEQKNPEVIELLQKAVATEKEWDYYEPPSWYEPMEQVLGFAYLDQQLYAEAEEAFRTTLKNLRRNGRSLFGLWKSLQLQGRKIDAYWVEREMKDALGSRSINF